EANLIILDTVSETFLGKDAKTVYRESELDTCLPPSIIAKLIGQDIKVQLQLNYYNIKNTIHVFTITKFLIPTKVPTSTLERGHSRTNKCR
ncbi:hypothetical protein LINPERHAP1_LOCUS29434, partial [Linum perenne]